MQIDNEWLGHYPQKQQNTPRKKVTPSQLRRRERRSAARQSSAEQAEVSKLDSFINISDVSEKEADTSITSLCKGAFKYYIIALEGGGGLTETADAADALRGDWGSRVKVDDVILEQIYQKIPIYYFLF